MKKIIIILFSFLLINSVSGQIAPKRPFNQDGFYKSINDVPGIYHFKDSLDILYENLDLYNLGLSKDGFQLAYKGYKKLMKSGSISNPNYLTICDFTQPSTSRRLYLIDMKNSKVEIQTWVCHGRKSGDILPTKFSNKMSSYQSSIGFYVTGNPYRGRRGLSLRIYGIESDYNDNAFKRDVVIHGSKYIGYGKTGRSLGCPAVPKNISKDLINVIKNGSCFFIYYPLKDYLDNSKILS